MAHRIICQSSGDERDDPTGDEKDDRHLPAPGIQDGDCRECQRTHKGGKDEIRPTLPEQVEDDPAESTCGTAADERIPRRIEEHTEAGGCKKAEYELIEIDQQHPLLYQHQYKTYTRTDGNRRQAGFCPLHDSRHQMAPDHFPDGIRDEHTGDERHDAGDDDGVQHEAIVEIDKDDCHRRYVERCEKFREELDPCIALDALHQEDASGAPYEGGRNILCDPLEKQQEHDADDAAREDEQPQWEKPRIMYLFHSFDRLLQRQPAEILLDSSLTTMTFSRLLDRSSIRSVWVSA